MLKGFWRILCRSIAFNMDKFKIKMVLLSFTLKTSFIFQFLLTGIFLKEARIFQISLGYSVQGIKLSRSPHSLGLKNIRADLGQIRQLHSVEYIVFLSASGLRWNLSREFQFEGMASKDHHFYLFLNVLQCPNLTYLLIKNSRVSNKSLRLRYNGYCTYI